MHLCHCVSAHLGIAQLCVHALGTARVPGVSVHPWHCVSAHLGIVQLCVCALGQVWDTHIHVCPCGHPTMCRALFV